MKLSALKCGKVRLSALKYGNKQVKSRAPTGTPSKEGGIGAFTYYRI
ncbi:MAG: hypothetical protein P4L27_07620 [Ignavibacteriaceae bacterium]|nr:hypothetical protein [Ignavibacteriaceae bacterium]